MIKEIGADSKLQHRISQEFQALIMLYLHTRLIGVGGMRQCLMQPADMTEGNPQPPGKLLQPAAALSRNTITHTTIHNKTLQL